MSIEMADVSNLSIQPDGRQGSADEERIREKAREAHEQVRTSNIGCTDRKAEHAQANLHHATQQARVAAINAAASQAALNTATSQSAPGTKTPTSNKGSGPQAMKKTAGRYALADFAIERTYVYQPSINLTAVSVPDHSVASTSYAPSTMVVSTPSRSSTKRRLSR